MDCNQATFSERVFDWWRTMSVQDARTIGFNFIPVVVLVVFKETTVLSISA